MISSFAGRRRWQVGLLLGIAGVGGLLYGYDNCIIAAALLYLGKTVNLTLRQESLVVAAVMGGSTLASPIGGLCSELFGRKKMMIAAGVMFVASVPIIVGAQGFMPLFLGRTLQGLSAGMIAVVIPLYLAETLPAEIRGRGTAAFQWFLTIGIVASLAVGTHYAGAVQAVGEVARGEGAGLLAAQDHAWRAMFLSAIYPGALFLLGSCFIAESPRWLASRGRRAEARACLERTRTAAQAEADLAAMDAAALSAAPAAAGRGWGWLFQRRYVLPLALVCAVLALNQTTGINSILQFVVVILRHAGYEAPAAAAHGTVVTLVIMLFTLVGMLLVDRIGRRALLMIGTGGIVVALVAAAILFRQSEAGFHNVTASVRAGVNGGGSVLAAEGFRPAGMPVSAPAELDVLYAYAGAERLATTFLPSEDSQLRFEPDSHVPARPLTILRARFGALPRPAVRAGIMGCLVLFMASFACGPGVCVWLALTELLPTRIRSLGIGLGLLINQGLSAGIAAAFLPVVGSHGYSAAFLGWAACTVVYFAVAAWLLPETKGRTLEQIETHFAKTK